MADAVKSWADIIVTRKVPCKPRELAPVWTTKEEARLADMWHSGVSKAEICDALNRTMGAIQHRATRLELKQTVRHAVVPEKRARMPASARFEDSPEAVADGGSPRRRDGFGIAQDCRIPWRRL